MKWVGLILLMLFASVAFCHPRDSTKSAARHLEKKKSKIERQRHRIENRWDERSIQQKRTDRRMVFFLMVGAGIIATTINTNKE